MSIVGSKARGPEINFRALGLLAALLLAFPLKTESAPARSAFVKNGIDLFYKGKLRDAARAFDSAIQAKPEDLLTTLDAAIIHRDLEEHHRSQELFEEAKALAPANAHIRAALGWAAMRAGNRNTARSAFYEALKIQTDHEQALLGLARLNLDMGRPKSALTTIEHLLDSHPHNTIGHVFKARAYEALGKPRDAVSAYKGAYRTDPTYTEARLHLGRLYRNLKEPNEAWRQYKRILAVDSRHQEAKRQVKALRPKLTKKPSELIPEKRLKRYLPVARAKSHPKMPVVRVAIGTTAGGQPAAKKEIAFIVNGPFNIIDPETNKILLSASGGKPWKARKIGTGSIYEIVDPNGKQRLRFRRVVAVAPANPAKNSTIVQRLDLARGTRWAAQGDRQLKGTFEIRARGGRGLYLINLVPLEDYVYGVINEEMPVKFDVEALKAQAVIARNHALISKNQYRYHRRYQYDVCDGQHCQVFSGVGGESKKGRRAVDATRGEVLRYNKRLAQTPYSSNCGGHTQDSGEVGGGWHGAPYLLGRKDIKNGGVERKSPWELERWLKSRPKVFCNVPEYLHPSQFRWSRVLSANELGDRVRLRNKKLGYWRKLIIKKRAKSGNVNKLLVTGTRGRHLIQKETRMRGMFGLSSVRNTMFTVEIERNRKGVPTEVYIHGGGWGHNVGLCQYGALGRALAGQSYKEILAHYYRGTQIKNLNYGAVR